MNTLTRFLTLTATLALTHLHAADPKTLMTERGKLLLSEDFAKQVEAVPAVKKGESWTKGWRLRPGKWEFVDGVMKGTELKEDKHGAVARFPLQYKDVVIQYDVRVDGCRMTTLSINDAKEHVCRVLINKDGFTAQKDDHDHEGPDKAVKFGTQKVDIQPGAWKTVVLELKGAEMVAHIDGKVVAGAHELIATSKANFGFTVAGESASFRNLRVWEALPNEGWGQTKAKLTAAK
jgi:hypothetical protein